MYKATYRIEIVYKKPVRGVEGADMTVDAEIPFVPAVGMWIAAVKADDFRQVQEVYWTASLPDRLEIFFEPEEDESPAGVKAMKELGWKEED